MKQKLVIAATAGGAGAVGHYAIQFAKLAGASQVMTTVSGPEKAEHALKELHRALHVAADQGDVMNAACCADGSFGTGCEVLRAQLCAAFG